MPSRVMSDAELEVLRQHHAGGLSLRRTAAEMGRPVSTVRDAATRLGLGWDRSRTAAATAAAATDMAARRAELAKNLLSDAERIREQMWVPTTVYNFGGKDNDFNERELPEAPADVKRTLMQTAATALTAHLRLVDHDSDGGVTEAKSVLDGFMDAIARRATELGAGDP